MTTHPMILALDQSGNPLNWIRWQEACLYYSTECVAWSLLDDKPIIIKGGISKQSGQQSEMLISPIIAIRNRQKITAKQFNIRNSPRLTNSALFYRDRHICAYCGKQFPMSGLSCDHIIPVSLGGENNWMNVVTSCISCNNFKGGRTPEKAGMELIFFPYVPSRIEHLILSNRKILSDQQEFLERSLPKTSRLINNQIADARYTGIIL